LAGGASDSYELVAFIALRALRWMETPLNPSPLAYKSSMHIVSVKSDR